MPPTPEEMNVEPGHHLDGEAFIDFVVEDGMGNGFLARLEGEVLDIGWHGGRGNLKSRLQMLQALVPETLITTVKGYATADFKDIVEGSVAGQRFDPVRWSSGLSTVFGGQWSTELRKRGSKWTITSTRMAGS